ncbi:MAG TPA: response regulator transcription factor [Rhodocyclaceae bacterium]|nr:response regulator transcription factor [Rhodocyclaceae bacterium]
MIGKTRVLIVDDHAVVRSGIRQFLANVADMAVVGEAASGHEALAVARGEAWDVILVDIALPDLNGLEVLRRLRREHPQRRVLVFSMHSEDEFAMPALNAGASGYLNKDSPPAEILAAIRTVAAGNRYVSPALTDRLLAGTLTRGAVLPHEKLSPREHQIMLLISRGVPLTRIGERLHLSVKTVSAHRTRILEKTGLGSNAELTRYVLEHKLD